MFVATIDIWPHGEWSRAERTTTIVACNDGTGSSAEGNYQAIFIDGEHDYDECTQRLMLIEALRRGETVKVKGFPRNRDQHHLPALVAALIHAHGSDEFLVDRP